MSAAAITLSDVTLAHDRHMAVQHLSGTFAAGSLTAVVGPNGAGKTTLLRAIAGLHAPVAGRIDRGGLTPAQIALLPQASAMDRSFPISCLDVVALGDWARSGAFRGLSSGSRGDAVAALARVGMAGFEGRPVGALSAGQFQRVLFARLLMQDAQVMLLDEPFTAVDERTEAELMALLRAWHAEGRTLIVVSHDLDLVAQAFPETLLLARRAVAWGPTETTLAAANRHRARVVSDAWSDAA
jgi:zinc/manganese transport system ATP-binding protein